MYSKENPPGRKEFSLDTSGQECLNQGCGENEDGGGRLDEINMQETKSAGLDEREGRSKSNR